MQNILFVAVVLCTRNSVGFITAQNAIKKNETIGFNPSKIEIEKMKLELLFNFCLPEFYELYIMCFDNQ
jgi:hypothetical protein